MKNDDENIEQIFESLGTLIGEGELEARKIMGDEQYEKTVALMERSNELSLQRESVEIKFFEARAVLQTTIAFCLLFGCVMSIAWSLVAWIN